MARTPQLVPFEAEHLDAAAALVAARQARLRDLEPLLPARWCEPPEARTLIEAALAAEHASGLAALEGDRLVGFLIGGLQFEQPWGRCGWVEAAGHAADPDRADVMRDLFAAWAEPQLGRGIFRFLVNVLSGEPAALEPWYQLNFGQMHAYAIRSTDASDLAPPPGDVRTRLASTADVAVMEAASEVIWREQAGPPSWSPIIPEQVVALRADFAEELSLEGDEVFVAEDAASGEALGFSVTYPMEAELDIPAGSMKLAATGTFEAARRRGVGRALVHAVLRNAVDRGAAWIVTDWRTSSLLASRAWPALGWRRTRIRLERQVDERIAWANVRW